MENNQNIAANGGSFINEVKSIIADARHKAYSAINSAMVEAYWLMGKRIAIKPFPRYSPHRGEYCHGLIINDY